MIGVFRAAAGLVLALGALVGPSFALPPPAAPTAAPPVPDLLVPDPSVVRGTLANGLRYAIKQQGSHQQEVILFRVEAGSHDETDAEQGLAHFVEHMAFNSSRNFPDRSLIKTFETAGIAAGRDQNAATTYFETLYSLDIPNVDAAKLDLGFRWLGDVADGLTLAPAEVDLERGAVLSEYRLGLGPQKDLADAAMRFATPSLRPIERLPIGQRRVIEGADAAALKQFRQRWYRPQNVMIVAVGDEPPQAIKARIEATFAGWTNPTPQPKREGHGQVDFQRPMAVRSLSDPHMGTIVGVCRYSPKAAHEPESVEVTRAHLADTFWQTAFTQRVTKLIRSDDPPFVAASGGYATPYRTVGETCFHANARLDDWRTALAALSREIRRIEANGVTDGEFASAKAQTLAEARSFVLAAPTIPAKATAESILSNMIEGDTYDTAEEDLRVRQAAADKLDRAAVAAAFKAHWTEASAPLITVVGPKPVSEAEIASAWTALQSEPPPSQQVDKPLAIWHYGDASPAGQVSRRVELKDPDFTRFVFDNGVVFNFKQTDFDKDKVEIRIRFGSGQQEIPADQAFAAMLGGSLLLNGAFAQNSIDDLAQLCQAKLCSATLSPGRSEFTLRGSSRSPDLSLELQLLTGLLREPGFRPNIEAAIPTNAAALYRRYRLSPVFVGMLKLNESLPAPRIGALPSEAQLSAIKAADLRSLLQQPLTTDPLEVTIVGDIDEATALPKVARTLGALPPRADKVTVRPDAVRVRFDAASPPPMTAYHQGVQDQAAVIAVWPLFVWTPDKVHEARVVALLTALVQDELLARVRQKLGKSYSPTAQFSLVRGGDQGSLSVQAQTSPEGAADVRAEILSIAQDLARGAITAEQLEQARKPMVETQSKQRTFNAWWLATLDGSNRNPDQLDSTRTWDADVPRIGLAEVKAEARKWLARSPYLVTVLPEPAAAAGITKN